MKESTGQKLWKRRAKGALGNRRSDFHFSHSFNNNKLDDRDHFQQNAKTSVASLRGLIGSSRNVDRHHSGMLIDFIGIPNLGGIRISCRVSARPFSTKPGESRNGLRATTTAYEISANGSKTLVPSEVHYVGGGGGGFGPNPAPEWVEFDVLIPLDSVELDAEARRYLAKVEASMTPEQKTQIPKDAWERGLERLRPFVYQQRLGHFQVDCRVLDGSRVMGADVVELEVLFKGRFSDIGLPGWSPA